MRSANPVSISVRHCAHEAALATEAQRLASMLRRGDCLRLEGTLGAGKTSFARALIRALSSPDVEVASPTFTLLQSYPVRMHEKEFTLWHADLYRLEEPSALQELGLHELPEQGALLVEWPAIAEEWLPAEALTLRLSVGDTETSRRLEYLAAAHSGWAERLAA